MGNGRKSPSTVTAIVSGEPTTIRSGDTVTISWTRYGTRPAGTTHKENGADRDGRGRFVRLVNPAYRDRSGRDRGPAILLTDQENVKPRNVLAELDHDGRVVGRWLPLYRADGTPTTQIVAVHR